MWQLARNRVTVRYAMRSAAEVRRDFIDFFKDRTHTEVPSSPVVSADDPTLLFANAGMNQFKDVFLGTGTRPYRRAVNTQKCIRASGKHNDLEDVGHDTYHHTYFEMLGNWSFGDYFKAEAIKWAWQLLTEVWQVPKERLYATVFAGDVSDGLEPDEESADLWRSQTDIDSEHIQLWGKKDNFWEMAHTGPCGPNSEIHIDRTPEGSGGPLVNADDPRVVEIWNLVFIQFNRTADGVLRPLPDKHVDTGLGFERMVAVLQDTDNYSTDVFRPLLDQIGDLAGTRYDEASPEEQIAFRVLADHARMLTFSITDGALPSNEGRGYVLRRVLRRAARYGRKLGLADQFLHRLVSTVAEMHGDVFPDVAQRVEYVGEVVRSEEASFDKTLGRGLELFNSVADALVGGGTQANGDGPRDGEGRAGLISGEDAFRLYDTYGFPLDLTRVMAEERGLTVDEAGFDEQMAQQRERARQSAKFATHTIEADDWTVLDQDSDQEFVGYEQTEIETTIHKYVRADGVLHVVLTRTPFYAEGGGQVGDRGSIDGTGFHLQVEDTQRVGDFIVCRCPDSGADELVAGAVTARVDADRRVPTTANHTATHLLHRALRRQFGDHVQQAGSLVAPDHLRFDFTHFKRIEPDELLAVEAEVNLAVRTDYDVEYYDSGFDEAKADGATALFGEKYGDVVRVVAVGAADDRYSLELCGGCHVTRTGHIGPFLITSEGSIASGVRRIEAVTGEAALHLVQQQRQVVQELSQSTGAPPAELAARTAELQDEVRSLQKQLRAARAQALVARGQELVDAAEQIGDVRLMTAELPDADTDALKQLAETLRQRGDDIVVFAASGAEGKLSLVCGVSDELAKRGVAAGALIKAAATAAGGGGGGKPTLATAGAKNPSKLAEAQQEVRRLLSEGEATG